METEVATTLTDDGFEPRSPRRASATPGARANTVLRSLIAAHNAGEAIGAGLMSDEVQLIQRIVQDLNNVRTQLQTSRSQIGEITTTLEILADQPDEHAVYRAVGPLLLEVLLWDDLKASSPAHSTR